MLLFLGVVARNDGYRGLRVAEIDGLMRHVGRNEDEVHRPDPVDGGPDADTPAAADDQYGVRVTVPLKG